MLQLLAIGEVMAEIRQARLSDHGTKTTSASGFSINFAGDTFNTAIYCQRQLGTSQTVGFVSRIGTDPLSDGLVAMAQSESLSCDYLARDSARNIGIYSVATDNQGERSFHYWRNQSAARGLFTSEETELFLPQASMIYLSGITLAILPPIARERLFTLLAERRAKGTKIAFDSNYRPSLWESADVARAIMSQMWSLTDIGLPSLDDEMALFGDKTEEDAIARFSAQTFERLAIKRGDRGPLSPHLAPADHPEFAPAKQVIDTTAAGDSFNGGYFAAYLQGHDEAACLLAGHNLAAKVVTMPGAIMPR